MLAAYFQSQVCYIRIFFCFMFVYVSFAFLFEYLFNISSAFVLMFGFTLCHIVFPEFLLLLLNFVHPNVLGKQYFSMTRLICVLKIITIN